MLKKHSWLAVALMIGSDLVLTALGWVAAYWMRFSTGLFSVPKGMPAFGSYLQILPAVVLVTLVSYRTCGLYRPRRTGAVGDEVFDVCKATALAGVLLLAFLSIYRSFDFSRLFMPIYFGLQPLLIILSRVIARKVLYRIRRLGWNQREAMIVGAGRMGQEVLERVRRNPWTGIHVACFVDDREERMGKIVGGVPVAGSLDEVGGLIRRYGINQVFLALPMEQQDRLRRIAERLAEETVDLRIVPDMRGFATLNLTVSDFDGIPIVSLRESPLFGWQALIKRALDVALSALALAFCAFPMILIAVIIKLTSPGPVFYRQERMGLDGRLFKMLKFRTMRPDAEAGTGPVWAKPGDERRSRFGSFLRATSLDELPQFINVLLGQMSVVGPRPERPIFINDFKKSIPRYMLRHRMKAGITGWAQVNGWRGDTSLEKRIQYDIYYIENWSIGFDVRIMLLTVVRGLVNRNAY